MENSKTWGVTILRLFVAMATVYNILIRTEKKNPGCVANLHGDRQELKPKVEANSSFLVLHPSSGVDTVNTVGSHLKGNLLTFCLLLKSVTQ